MAGLSIITALMLAGCNGGGADEPAPAGPPYARTAR